jgi:cytochrome c
MSVDASAQYAGTIAIMNKNDCKSCHSVTEKVLGPAFTQVAKKYKGDPGAPARLAKKIITGGSGVWGDAMMPAHPTLADNDANAIVKYILSLANPVRKAKSLPVNGTYSPAVPEGENNDGSFILRAAYTDRGARLAPAQTAESILVLHSPVTPVSQAVQAKEVTFNRDSTIAMTQTTGAWLKFRADLTDIKQLELIQAGGRAATDAAGVIEVHSGSPQGALLGKFSGNYTGQMSLKINLANAGGITDLYFVFNGSPLRIKAIRFNEGN